MNAAGYDTLIGRFHEAAKEVTVAKRHDYTGNDDDVLKNFKAIAERAGLTALQVWTVYMLKQIDAVTSAVKFPGSPPSEPISQRFIDIHNYTNLGLALFCEKIVPSEHDPEFTKWATLNRGMPVPQAHPEGEPVVDEDGNPAGTYPRHEGGA